MGQVAGQINQIRRAADVLLELAEGYIETSERLNSLNERFDAAPGTATK